MEFRVSGGRTGRKRQLIRRQTPWRVEFCLRRSGEVWAPNISARVCSACTAGDARWSWVPPSQEPEARGLSGRPQRHLVLSNEMAGLQSTPVPCLK